MTPARLRQPRGAAVLIAAVAALAAIDVQAHGPVAVRAPAGLLLVLVLPGWPWLAFSQRQRRTVETAALIVGASLGITIVTGLVLDLLPSHLTRGSWSLGLLAATLIGTVVLWLRSARLKPAGAAAAPSTLSGERGLLVGWSARRRAGFGAGSVMLLALLAVLAVVSVDSQQSSYRREHYTALSLNSTSADVLGVEVVNHEEATVGYRLTAVSQGQQVFLRRLVLRSGGTAVVNVRLSPDAVLLDAPLDIHLYRLGRSGLYRGLSLTPHEGRWF